MHLEGDFGGFRKMAGLRLESADHESIECDLDIWISEDQMTWEHDNLFLMLLSSSCSWNYSRLESRKTKKRKRHCDKPSKKPKEKPDDAQNSKPDKNRDRGHQNTNIDDTHERNAWGLVLYPVSSADKYIRIGVFKSKYDDGRGGLRHFDDVPTSLVKII